MATHIRVSASRTYCNLDTLVCDICGTIPDFAAANLLEGETLPGGVADLVDAYPSPEGCWDTSKDTRLLRSARSAGNSSRIITTTSFR